MPNIHLLRAIKELPKSGLFHNDHDDSRYVEGENGTLIRFTSDLQVYKGNDVVGRITTSTHISPYFTFFNHKTSEVYNTEVECRDWHWTALENAEIKIALYLLGFKEKG